MKKLIIFLFAICFFQNVFSQTTNTNIVAEIKVETTDNISTLISNATNTTDVYFNLKYSFSVITFDLNYDPSKRTAEDFFNTDNQKAYSSKESVDDLFTLNPYQSKQLYQTSINTGIENMIIVLLLIFDDNNKLIGKNRIVFNESKADSEVESEKINKPNDGVEISGIVVEETKTKSGKDFYDSFYFYYSFNNIKGDEVVKIDEMRTFRNSTKIMITIGDETIFEFFARPNEEYIDQMSKISMQKVYKYFQKKQKDKSYITQY